MEDSEEDEFEKMDEEAGSNPQSELEEKGTNLETEDLKEPIEEDEGSNLESEYLEEEGTNLDPEDLWELADEEEGNLESEELDDGETNLETEELWEPAKEEGSNSESEELEDEETNVETEELWEPANEEGSNPESEELEDEETNLETEELWEPVDEEGSNPESEESGELAEEEEEGSNYELEELGELRAEVEEEEGSDYELEELGELRADDEEEEEEEEGSDYELEELGKPTEGALVYKREPPVIVGKMGVVKFGDSPAEKVVDDGPTEVILKEDYEIPKPNSSRILLVKETAEPDTDGIIVTTPLPFLGHFTSFDRGRRKPKAPPKVQSRWRLVRIPLRVKQDLPPRPPEPTKIIHPLESEWTTPGWIRPHVPIDSRNGRRILHHFPVTGDKKHFCKLLRPSGFYQKHKGGGWICRRWTKRPYPRKMINHTEEEWANAQNLAAKREMKMHGSFDEDFAEVWAGIEGTDEGIMKQTQYTINKDRYRLQDKKVEMWEQWDLNVFNYIQRQTGNKINDKKYRADQVSLRNTALQTKYCEAVKKRKMFRDIIHADEYNPFEFRDAALKYNDKQLKDPMKHDLDKDKREKKFMGDFVSQKCRTREMMSMRDWPEPQFKTSLAGRVTCDDELQDRVHLAAVPEKWVSKDVFWNKRFGPEAWHTSFPKGGKCTNVPRPPPSLEAPPPVWKGIRIVWDVECKKLRQLQISELNPNF